MLIKRNVLKNYGMFIKVTLRASPTGDFKLVLSPNWSHFSQKRVPLGDCKIAPICKWLQIHPPRPQICGRSKFAPNFRSLPSSTKISSKCVTSPSQFGILVLDRCLGVLGGFNISLFWVRTPSRVRITSSCSFRSIWHIQKRGNEEILFIAVFEERSFTVFPHGISAKSKRRNKEIIS